MSGESGQRGLRWPFRITTERCDGVLVLTAAGRLGHASAGALSAALDAAIAPGNRGLVIDLTQVDYLSSAGLTAIDKAAARLAGVGEVLVLCEVAEPVRIALDLAGFLSHFPIEPSRKRAVARVASRTGPLNGRGQG